MQTSLKISGSESQEPDGGRGEQMGDYVDSGRPASVPFFVERLVNAATAPKKRPRIGLLCNIVPPELAMAAGADVVRLDCGSGRAVATGEKVLCGDACALAKAAMGAFTSEDAVQASCDAFIIPATCDSRRQLAKALDSIGSTFHFCLPEDRAAAGSAEAITAELQRLAAYLGKITGKVPTANSLQVALAQTRRRSEIVSQLVDARITNPGCLTIRDLFVCVQSSLFSPEPIDTWLTAAEALLAEVQSAHNEGRKTRRRVILTGSPVIWPNFKPLNIIEECGALVIADTLCSGAQACLLSNNSVPESDDLVGCLKLLADRIAASALCPCSSTEVVRLQNIVELAQKSLADGVVQYSVHLCHPAESEGARLGRALRERRIPFLNLRTGYDLDDARDLRVQMEMFLESM